MKIKTVLFIALLLGSINPAIAGANGDTAIDVTPDEGGDVKLTTDEVLQRVTEKNIKHIQVVYDSNKDGSLHIFGDSKKGIFIYAIRRGTGDGDVIRDGASDGSAYRGGAGNGNVIWNGNGDGDAYRFGNGDGDAIKLGGGIGIAIKKGAGKGDAYINGVKQ